MTSIACELVFSLVFSKRPRQPPLATHGKRPSLVKGEPLVVDCDGRVPNHGGILRRKVIHTLGRYGAAPGLVTRWNLRRPAGRA